MLRFLAALAFSALSFTSVLAASENQGFYYVYNTEPPDAFLSLRTLPTIKAGGRIATMPNGTLLEVIEKQSDGWWMVKVVETGAIGWTLSSNGKKDWIACCKPSGEITRPSSLQLTGNASLEMPAMGSPNRTAIMDAIRKPLGANTKFVVRFLKTIKSSNGNELAFTIVESANKNIEIGGSFLLEKRNGVWVTLYTVGGTGGVDECKKAQDVVGKIISTASSYNAPRTFLADEFWSELQLITNSDPGDTCNSAEIFR